MKSISFPPGAYNFRLIMIVILVVTMMVAFFRYTDKISIATEKASIQQTKNIINSTLAIVFATYAVKGELGRLNELNDGNPFVHLAEYNLLPGNYHGEILTVNLDNIEPGWYYLKLKGKVIYKAYYSDEVYYFSITLKFNDIDGSGRYEPEMDLYQMLYFRRLLQ